MPRQFFQNGAGDLEAPFCRLVGIGCGSNGDFLARPHPPQFLPQQQIDLPPAPAAQTNFNGLSVQDEKGNAMPLQATTVQPAKGANGVVWQYTLTIPALVNSRLLVWPCGYRPRLNVAAPDSEN